MRVNRKKMESAAVPSVIPPLMRKLHSIQVIGMEFTLGIADIQLIKLTNHVEDFYHNVQQKGRNFIFLLHNNLNFIIFKIDPMEINYELFFNQSYCCIDEMSKQNSNQTNSQEKKTYSNKNNYRKGGNNNRYKGYNNVQNINPKYTKEGENLYQNINSYKEKKENTIIDK
jgi:hypothetical protein